MDTPTPKATTHDRCPAWAIEKIEQLRQIEIFLGNIPKALAWQSDHVDDLVKRSFRKEEAVFDDAKAEMVFERIVRGLHAESFTPAEIASFVNARVGYEGGPPYCDASEVAAVLAPLDR